IDRFPDRAFVITCADPIFARKVAPWLSCHLTVQKPYEPDLIEKIVVSKVSRDGKYFVRSEQAAMGMAPGKYYIFMLDAYSKLFAPGVRIAVPSPMFSGLSYFNGTGGTTMLAVALGAAQAIIIAVFLAGCSRYRRLKKEHEKAAAAL